MDSSSAIARFDRRYLVVLGACLTQFTIIGLLFSYGLFFKELEAEFGWSRTILSSSTSITFLVMGILAFVGGRLSDRYGPRLVLAISGTLCGAGYALLSQVTQPWQLFAVFGLLIGVGMATHDVVTLSTIARQFHQRRGIMTGIVKVGTALGQVVVPPAAALLIALTAWRPALMILGITAIFLLQVAAWLMRDQSGTAATAAARSAAPGLMFQEAVRTRTLWMICIIQFSFFSSLTTIPLHIVVHGMDLGMSPATAAALLSILGGTSIAGRLAVGAGVDRLGGRRTLMFNFVPLLLSLLSFLVIDEHWALFAGVALYGFAHGGFFTVTSPNVANYFGLKAHGTIFGLVLFCGTLAGAAGPILAGWIFDQTGSYVPAFTTLIVLALAGLVLAWRLPASSAAS